MSAKTAEEMMQQALTTLLLDVDTSVVALLCAYHAAAQAEAEVRGRKEGRLAGLEEAARIVEWASLDWTPTDPRRVIADAIRALAARAPTTPLGRNEPTDNLGRKRSTTWWTGAPRYLDPATGEEVPTCRECGSLTSGGRCSNCGNEAGK